MRPAGMRPLPREERQMLRIGMVGAENSHTAAIAKVLNVDKRIPGVRATCVWGETRGHARKAAE